MAVWLLDVGLDVNTVFTFLVAKHYIFAAVTAFVVVRSTLKQVMVLNPWSLREARFYPWQVPEYHENLSRQNTGPPRTPVRVASFFAQFRLLLLVLYEQAVRQSADRGLVRKDLLDMLEATMFAK